MVGWVERSETQQMIKLFVGFRKKRSTQPTIGLCIPIHPAIFKHLRVRPWLYPGYMAVMKVLFQKILSLLQLDILITSDGNKGVKCSISPFCSKIRYKRVIKGNRALDPLS